MSEYCENCYKLQAQYDNVAAQNKQLQQERMRLISDNNFVRAELNQIKLLLEGKNTQCSGFEERSEKYLKALDEIEQYCNKYGQNSIGFRQNILEIIKKTKEGGK